MDRPPSASPLPLRTRCIHILEACSDPERRPRPAGLALGLAVLSANWRVIRTPSELSQALSLHRTPDDVPANTTAAREAMAGELRAGRQLVQFTLTVPDPASEREQGPRIVRRQAEAGTLVLGVYQLAGLLAVSPRHTWHAFDHGLVDVLLSERRGLPCRYGVVNERMAQWSRRHARWVERSRVRVPSTTCGPASAPWFGWEHLGHGASMFGKLDPVTERPLLYVAYPWIHWAAGRRPADELGAILKAQVTE